MSEPETASTPGLTPEEASAALGNTIRAAILRALWKSPGEDLSFSELRRRAGNPDSGQFNYHLGELVGSLVEQTAEGYRPLQSGMRVLRTALFGVAENPPTLDAFSIKADCPYCGGELEASYDGHTARVQCPSCGKIQLKEVIPTTAFEARTPEETVSAFDRWVLGRSMLVVKGVCPDCAGKPETTLFQTRTGEHGNLSYLRARHVCGTCGYECDIPVWLHVLLARPPAVSSFYYEREVDLEHAPVWEITGYGNDARVTLEAETPLRVGIEFAHEDALLRLTLDEELAVVDATTIREAGQVADD